jgi:hypothetical protein
VIVYDTTTVPALTPVTKPFAATVATAVLAEDQTGLVAVVLRRVVPPIQTEFVPVMAAVVGKAFTVTTVGADVTEQPFASVTVTV